MKRYCLFALSVLVWFNILTTSCQREEFFEEPEQPVNPTPGGDDDNTDTTAAFLPTGALIPNAVTDYDGNHYDAVVIGNQVWMAENLTTTHFADGEEIPLTEGYSLSNYCTTAPYRYVPDAGTADVEVFGYLYNWCAVMHGASGSESNPSGVQGICPDGWHVPSDAEWNEFADTISSHPEYVIGDDIRNIDKALASTIYWYPSSYPNSVGNIQSLNNATHFAIMPAGTLLGDSPSGCGLGDFALLWSCTEYKENPKEEAWFRYINNQSSRAFHVRSGAHDSKARASSVRCLRDVAANPGN